MSQNDSTSKTLIVAVVLCLVCSIVVSSAAVILKPLQLENKGIDKQKNILQVANLLTEDADVKALFDKYVEARVVDLATGEYADMDAADYDQRKAARDPAQNVVLNKKQDIASIKTRARYATVYLIKEDAKTSYYILPVHGYGLWSTLYGFIALKGDLNTVYGLSFYEHAETPGLGGEVDNRAWKASWRDKQVFDQEGDVRLQVIKGKVDSARGGAEHQIDGLAGATLTSRGVSNLLKYWMSEQGFGPYLDNLRKSRG